MSADDAVRLQSPGRPAAALVRNPHPAVCALLPVTILWALIGVWPGLAVGLAAQAGLIWVGVQFGSRRSS
ncbi:hypothetical protein [Streptomyces sp. NPDC005009]